MSISFIDGIICRKRADLDDLERFSRTHAYAQLLRAAWQCRTPDRERWLADWLITPAFGLGSRPLDLASEPDGVNRLISQLTQISRG
jgi:hypothetical protein